ncbi:MAG: hypothetical protein ABW098_12865 [Candidatus Thiodiazotropha sp.]
MESGLTINAEYLDNESQAPAILILHGFLQTRDSFTLRRLGKALHEAGYRILLPNLSLGINDRRQSLACEAIHNHPMEQDTKEIAYLSYLAWDQQRVLQAVSTIKPEPTIIFGGDDNRLTPEWKPQLQTLRADIIEIDGANHFFDHTHEFDLLDSIEQSLKKL